VADFLPSVRDALSGRYELGRELGRGGMATVFAARDVRHGRDIALKLLHPEIAMALGSERFLLEIEVTARLNHPHILPLLDSGRAGALPYYAMPLVRGGSLRARLDREGPLPLPEAIAITAAVAEGLDYAAAAGFVHRDIKPENILLQDAHALIADFGIARALDVAGGGRLTETGITIGTPLYMSPEQATASPRLDGRSDQYSLACVLYEMLTGVPPFTGPTAQAIIARHTLDPVPPIRTLRRSVPREVEGAITRALAKTPADRFGTAGEFVAALTTILPEEGRAGGIARRTRWGVIGAICAVLLTVGVTVRGRLLRPNLPLNPDLVAILPFEARCSGQFAVWCGGVPNLLASTFAGAGQLRAVEPRLPAGADSAAGAGAEWASTIARSVGAARFITGTVIERGGELQVSATLHGTSGSGEILSQAMTRGPVDAIYRLIDELAAQLLVGQETGESGRLSRLAAATTESLGALKSFLQGEAEMRAGRFDSAVSRLREAVAVDTAFVLGWARLAEAASYTDDLELASRAGMQAARGADRLGRRDSTLAAGLATADFDHAERLLQALLRADSTDAAAWGALGDLLMHGGPIRGRPVREILAAFGRAVALGDTTQRNLNHLNWAAAMAGDSAAYDSLLALTIARYPDGFMTPIHRLELSVVRGDSAEQRAALTAIPPGISAWASVGRLAISGHPREASAAAALLAESGQPLNVRALGHAMRGAFAAAQGQWATAEGELRLAARFDPVHAAEIGAYLALVPALSAGRPTLDSLAGLLDGLAPPPPPAADDPWVFPDAGIHRELLQYLQGLLQVRVGNWGVADSLARRLLGRDSSALTLGYAESLRASAAAARGHHAEALALLEGAPLEEDSYRYNGSPFYSLAYERFLRAWLLDQVGRDEEALRWYRTVGVVSLFDVAYLAPSLLHSARILEEMGRLTEAADAYRRFLRLWERADPGLQPIVGEARSRLASLTRGRG
jgi:serine/threonine-protein kinase